MKFIARLQSFVRELKDPARRHRYVESYVRTGLPLQIRAMRQDREWNQTALADKLGTTQNSISRLESPRSNPPTIKTLLRIARAFDVALVVRFMRFSDYAKLISGEHTESIAVPGYEKDQGLNAPAFSSRTAVRHLEWAALSETPGMAFALAGPVPKFVQMAERQLAFDFQYTERKPMGKEWGGTPISGTDTPSSQMEGATS